MEEFCGGPLWDSNLTWVSTDPDFTPCFMASILVWVPCVFLFLAIPYEAYNLKTSRYANIPWGLLNISKLIVLTLLVILSFIEMGFAIDLMETNNLYPVHIITPIIKILTFNLALILVIFHRKYGIRASGAKFIFSFFLMVFAIAQFRSEIRNYSDTDSVIGDAEQIVWTDVQFVIYMIYFPLVVILFLLYCFGDLTPRESDFPKQEKPSPQLGAGFLSEIMYQWFDRMTWRGFRNPLEAKDMWDIRPEDSSRELIPPFDKYFQESIDKNRKKQEKEARNPKKNKDAEPVNLKKTNGSVLPALVKGYGGPFWLAGVLKIILDLLTFASPFLMRFLIAFAGNDEPLWKGLMYAFGLFAVSILTSLMNGQYFFHSFLVGFRIRSGLISAIYRKALRISSSAKKDSTVGEIVNLMAVDAQRFFELTSYLHLIWSGPFQIGLCLYFLWDILGPSVMAGFIVMLLLVPLNGFIAVKLRSFQIEQMKKKDERVKFMNEILNGIKVLKLYAWEPSFEESVHEVRNGEMVVLRKAAIFNSGTFFIWSMAPFLVSLASFATYVLVDENNVLDADTAFVSLALFNILRFPMALFPMVVTFIMQAWVAIERINKFMNTEELDPTNVTHEPSDEGLTIKDGEFSWDLDENSVLHDINLAVPKKSLVAVVGPVGCGKSSLVAALLGEMEKTKGSVNTDGSIAFVPQQAWIQNATLRDNIIFGQPYNESYYNKVVDACALRPDIEMLPGGDQTEIGEKGINLSGGQKQRVALARAVYANSDIYFLDDPLSAVDSHVGKHIFDYVIGPNGILAGKTRLLVTHGISFLPQMDNIYVMKNGNISESGTYKVLLGNKGAFSEFLIEHLQEYQEDDEDLEEIKQVLGDNEGKKILERAMSIRSISSNGSDKESSKRRLSRKSSTNSRSSKKEIVPVKKDNTRLIDKEESATGGVGWDVYIRYFQKVGVWYTIFTIAFNIVNQGLSVFSNTWLTFWAADEDSAVPAVRDMYLGVYGGLGFGQALTMFATSIIFSLGALRAAKSLHNILLANSFRLPMSFFDTTPLGRVMNRFSKDVDVVDNTLPMSVRTWMSMFFNVIAILIVISVSTPWFMVVIVPIAALYYIIQRFYVATSRQLKRIESVTRSPIYSHFGESLTGQMTIRAYNVQDRFKNESEEKVDYNQLCSYPSIIANRWLGVRLEIVGSLIILFAALFTVLDDGSISPALVGLSISYALQITQTLSFLVRMTAEVETNIVAIERIEEYINLPQEAAWQKGSVDPTWPQTGVVEFKDFQVRYREGLDLVLKGISFTVQGSEKVGIVGRTGAGKSSLTLALFRIIESAGGKIIIDGQDIADLGLHNLRSRLTIIPQDPVLFSGTLRMNIDPFNAYSDDDIWRVLEHSHLKSYVKGLPLGLLHKVAEGGENMSVGQRQLVCLGRALLRKTKVLILDEATAAIDLETDDLIQKTIRTEFKDCTILTIAHRLNTILDSDKVIVLDKGMIVEFDAPQTLLKDSDGIFYSMAKKAGLV